MLRLKMLCAAFVAATVWASASDAKAQFLDGCYGGYGGFGLSYNLYSLDSPPPYFAMFPPVYYSHITPRPYGFSPFAYPGWVETPRRVPAVNGPIVYNRYAEPAQFVSKRRAEKPVAKMVKNPYVDDSELAPAQLAQVTKTVYPASEFAQ